MKSKELRTEIEKLQDAVEREKQPNIAFEKENDELQSHVSYNLFYLLI